ncbi:MULTISPECIES: hypothetical protein [Fischerella]|nr:MULTISPECIES: hypothetical protein [Fischerella]
MRTPVDVRRAAWLPVRVEWGSQRGLVGFQQRATGVECEEWVLEMVNNH